MTTPSDPRASPGTRRIIQGDHPGHGGHGWMMIACCVPVLLIAIVLVATSLAGPYCSPRSCAPR